MKHHDRLPDAPTFLNSVPTGATVIDVGCFGWALHDAVVENGLRLIGLDEIEPPGRPAGAAFHPIVDDVIELPDDHGDVLIASHVMEHVVKPTALYKEIVRVTKPGGLIHIEAPSELSAEPRGSSTPEDHAFVSFWDDPTHIRPLTPGAAYRLSLSCCTIPVAITRAHSGPIPVTRMIARKPAAISGAPEYRYISLKDVEPGLDAAWRAFWSGVPLTTEERTNLLKTNEAGAQRP